MTWLKQLAVVVLGCVAAGVMVLAGLWQLDVYRQQGADASAARAAEPARDLSTVAPAGGAVQDGFGRAVRFTGQYLGGEQLLVPLDDRPDRLRVLTALRTGDGSVVAVVRGLVPASTTIPPPVANSAVSASGLLFPSEDAADGPSAADRIGSVRIPALAQTWPGPLVEGYVLLSAADAAAEGLEPAPVVLPEGQGRLRNGAYALQWWVFAAFAIGMGVRIARDLGDRDTLVEESPEIAP